MKKWADYLVTKVSYAPTGSHIVALRVRSDKGDEAGQEETLSFNDVVLRILLGTTFITVTWSATGWVKGAPVELSLRTRRDATAKDNLSNLPRF
ncbi:hypothetical protein [Melittangium boletus]|uniref:Uncharacterized protein n=1 Tax=Melittangium boletus DSM 14713 TaxID=1294270 RepID=A0A250INA0_9BACT|nr:hypothetical protein [Melittangium boletus]ATB32730.1 hypothetical protein MEBOL_006219 [Melittangium boletus DSM 14713]